MNMITPDNALHTVQQKILQVKFLNFMLKQAFCVINIMICPLVTRICVLIFSLVMIPCTVQLILGSLHSLQQCTGVTCATYCMCACVHLRMCVLCLYVCVCVCVRVCVRAVH